MFLGNETSYRITEGAVSLVAGRYSIKSAKPMTGNVKDIGKRIFVESGDELIEEGASYADDVIKGGSYSVPDIGYNSFKELKADLGTAGEGNAWHHIVEQSQIGKSGFSSNQVNNVNNIISIPHGKGTVHAKISGYYSSKQFFTGGKSIREWLSGQSFEGQFEFGMNILKEYGDVTPTTNGWIFTPFE